MKSADIRQTFQKFFEKRGHAVVPSASLVPDEADKSVLFTTAGMQPLVPYLMGKEHPAGRRIANSQKCVRTQDINEVGDKTHDTFFEMLGNWSLGDYFKEDAIKWSFELLTSKEEGFGLDPSRLYITVFEGDMNAPQDKEAFEIWKKYIPENRIYFMGAKSNWWSMGENGPCGPDTEMFYDVTGKLGDMTKEEYMAADDRQEVVEIWNDVFMEYLKENGDVVGKLSQKNVDTGAGLERLAMVLQKKDDVFETDLFAPLMAVMPAEANVRSKRIVADHVRTSAFIIADGVIPSNTGRGYILRRLLRRAHIHAEKIGGGQDTLLAVLDAVLNHESYSGIYSFKPETKDIVATEVGKFIKTLKDGIKQLEKGADPFMLFTSYGFPIELTEEIAKEKGVSIDRAKFDEDMRKHQELSRAGAANKFKN